eukprot:TRINITY_DN3842_c0_g1_i1.p1 TRINITY_DN3842_c0_g1~~TRINITY_DN3842_c0_g1_i1.p1  ORF type:complete len:346 (+),score=17.12 TRINITY_DN3842_c0_g1_i1:150-1187(+)
MGEAKLLFFLISAVAIAAVVGAISDNNQDRETILKELLSLREGSQDGVIRLDDSSLKRFALAETPRDYSLIIFFDADNLRNKAELRLDLLRAEFGLAAKAFIKNNMDKPSFSKVFFCDIEFLQSQASFALFGINTLPHIRYVSPSVKRLKDSEAMDQGDLMSRTAESIVSFVEAKSKIQVGPIERPPPLTRNQIIFILAAALLSAPFILKKILLAKDTPFHEPKLWMAMAIFVYLFSVSGAMHNIIRNMPLFIADREDPSKPIFFYQGSGVQLGAEGFAVGFLYTIVGLLLAFVSQVVPRLGSARSKRIVTYLAMIVSVWCVRKVIYLDNWKTGYSIHAFWPSWI